jgi:prolyl 4-hydroxylase
LSLVQQKLDLHGAEWRHWLLSSLEKGCDIADLLNRMTAKVWCEADASAAIHEALAFLGRRADWCVPLPEIKNTSLIALSDRTVSVLSRIQKPRAALLDGVLSVQECIELIEYAQNKNVGRSGVVDRESGSSVEHAARTSSTVFLKRDETPLVARIENRLAELTQWPKANGEGLQILFYQVGQQYKPHFDWFDPQKPGSEVQLKRGGQRVATTILYLANADRGGATSLSSAGVKMQPRVGGAVFFNNLTLSGTPDKDSLHGGEPVEEGLKIVATYWQRQSEFF